MIGLKFVSSTGQSIHQFHSQKFTLVQIKIIVFHSIMLSNYLAFRMLNWIKSETTTVLLGLLYPITPHAHPTTYWITIYLSIACHGIVDIIRIVDWTLKKNNESKVNNRISHNYQIHCIQNTP